MKTKILLSATIILLQFIISAMVVAQAPLPKQWDVRFGGNPYDYLNSLQQTTDGGYILGGNSRSNATGDKTQNSRGETDYWIIKIDANGVKQWDKRFGGSLFEELRSVRQTTDGGYILGGFSYSGISGDKTESTRGDYDYWLVKTDINGIKQWDKRFGGSSADFLQSLQQTSDGGYILGGYSSSDKGGDKTQHRWNLANPYIYDYWVVKIDATGTKQWDKTFGGVDDDRLYSHQQTIDGGYILGGSSGSGISGDKTESSRGGNDYWILKIDANGTKLWDKRFGGNEDDALQSLQQTTDGGYILGGGSHSGISGDKTQSNWDSWKSTSDYWVVKIDYNGNKQWDRRFGGSAVDWSRDLHQTTDGGYILGGESESWISGDKTEPRRGNYGYDYWIVKINSTGTKEWNARFGGINTEHFYSLQETTDGGYILGGYSDSYIGGDKTQKPRGKLPLYYYWIVKLGCPPSAKVKHASLDLCQTDSVQLIADKSPGVKFQWLKEGEKLEGETKRILIVREPGRYRVAVGTDRECSQLSDVIKVTNSCGKTTQQINQSTVTVSPNPSHGIITLTYNSNTTGKVQLKVYDKTGKLNFTKTEQAIKGSNTYQLNLSHLINGMYNLQVNNGKEQEQVKLVIENNN